MNRIVLIALLINSVYFVGATTNNYKTVIIEDSDLCLPGMDSKISLRESQPGLLVKQLSPGEHHLSWQYDIHCHFVVDVERQQRRDFGVYAVIQNLNFRYEAVNMSCIDYIEFKGLGSDRTRKVCGTGHISKQPFTATDYSDFGLVAPKGEMDVTIHIDKELLVPEKGKTDMSIAFTLFENIYPCRESYAACGKKKECISSDLFGDGIVNCPYLYGHDENTPRYDIPVIPSYPPTTEEIPGIPLTQSPEQIPGVPLTQSPEQISGVSRTQSPEQISGVPLTQTPEQIPGVPLTQSPDTSYRDLRTTTGNTEATIAATTVAALTIVQSVTCLLIYRKCRRLSSQQSPVADVENRGAPLIATAEPSAAPSDLQPPQGIATSAPDN